MAWIKTDFPTTAAGQAIIASLVAANYAQKGVSESKLPLGVQCSGTIVGARTVKNDDSKEFLAMYVVTALVNGVPTECTVMSFDGLALPNGSPVMVEAFIHSNKRKYSRFVGN